mmetsp:Transcript_6861/g.14091  ORF Transcript_6861/g.14091 Transcript_6861/m.14091 type:complete len:1018 (+) Transcript_6861:102-3155(+)
MRSSILSSNPSLASISKPPIPVFRRARRDLPRCAEKGMVASLVILGTSLFCCHGWTVTPLGSSLSRMGVDSSGRMHSHTALDAKRKSNKRKIPKMPSLPAKQVASPIIDDETTSSEKTSTSSANVSADSITSSSVGQRVNNPAAESTMVVMDVENIRGATSFRISHEALLSRIQLWREDRLSIASNAFQQKQSDRLKGEGAEETTTFLEPLLWVCDHGMTPSIHHFTLFPTNDGYSENDSKMPHNFGVIFAGPGRSADDVIVDVVELRCSGSGGADATPRDNDEETEIIVPTSNIIASRNATIVITADAKLISRCQQARRKSSSLSDVIFVEPASLLQQLEKYRTTSVEEESFFGEGSSRNFGSRNSNYPVSRSSIVAAVGINDSNGRNKDGKTSTMNSFKESSIASEQHAKFQARFQNRNGKNEAQLAEANGATTETGFANKEETFCRNSNVDEDELDESSKDKSSRESNAAAIAAQLRTEEVRRRLLLSDAYYLARPSKNLRGRRAHTTMAAVHAKYKNRNISKKQQKKLFAKRFGDKKKEDMIEAANTRKQLAATLQVNLLSWEQKKKSSGSKSIKSGSLLLESLLGWFDEEKEKVNKASANSISYFESHIGDSGDGLSTEYEAESPDTSDILGCGTVGSNSKWDPLGSPLHVPLRPKDTEHSKKLKSQMKSSSRNGLQPLRAVVISDTHGFEGALARFPAPGTSEEVHIPSIVGDDFLLPQADILIHCGDFAASGSRKNQRAAARRLDDFLARQTHIPEKIVVQGNHDPDSPAKTLFPNSKALYIRKSSTIEVNGVSFALEPYSRKTAFRSVGQRMATSSSSGALSSFPKCDVLVSHEPPRGVLDLTYHGFSAGSSFLRNVVECAQEKPRLWLCGHIHEGRGVMKYHFAKNDEDGIRREESPTIVINAANANTGRANRLVSGAVIVDIDRDPVTIARSDKKATAEMTLKVRSVIDDDSDDIFPLNGDAGLGLHGMDELELYVTRPGVRRRKGIPQSVRKQRLQSRSTTAIVED